MYRKFYQGRGASGMQATCSTFTPPTSVFQALPDHVLDFIKELRYSTEGECPILHAKSTFTMSQWNCHCRKVTCIKIRQQQQCRTSMRSNLDPPSSSVASSPAVSKSRKYIARLHPTSHQAPTLRRISQHFPSEGTATTPVVTLRSKVPGVRRQQRRHVASYSQYLTGNPSLPSYGRVADSLDHVLRICSRLRHLLTAEESCDADKEEMIAKAKALVHVLQKSAYALHLFDKSAEENVGLLDCFENLAQIESGEDLPQLTKGFLDIVRRLIEETIHLNCWIIINYLDDCDHNDYLLPVATEHLIHLLLFESEPCLEVIQSTTIQNILTLVEVPTTPVSTSRLLLRALAVLCGVRAACVQLLSMGGFDTILAFLLHGTPECSIEAAGVISQLSRPHYGLIELGRHADAIVDRLLHLVEHECRTAETMLLCVSALSNIAGSQVNSGDSESTVTFLFDQKQTVRRILQSLQDDPQRRNQHVDEQVLALLMQFPEAVQQSQALPFLLSILSQTEDAKTQRLRHKTMLCLRMLGSSSEEEEEEAFRPIKIRSSPSSSSSAGFHSLPNSVPDCCSLSGVS